MDPMTALVIGAASQGAGMIANYQAARGEAQRAKTNAFIGRTRAMQSDTQARAGLEDELDAMRTVFGANQQRPGVGTLELIRELRTERQRERRITTGNLMGEAADWRMAGQNASARGRAGLLGDGARFGRSLFDIYEYRRQ